MPMEQALAWIRKGWPIVVRVRCRRFDLRHAPAVRFIVNATPLGVARKSHYLVLFGMDKDLRKVLVADPTVGLLAEDRRDLMEFWREAAYPALLVLPDKTAAPGQL